MRIECPTCTIGFKVSDDQVGQKGLCPNCETKFVIPADPSDPIEVLAEGRVDKIAEGKREKAKAKSKLGSERLRDADDDRTERDDRKRRLRADSSQLIERHHDDDDDDDDDDDFDSGGAGKAIGLLAIGLVLGLAIGFALGRLTAGDGAGAEGDGKAEAGDARDPFGLSETK